MWPTCVDCDNFHASACSRPPFPISSILRSLCMVVFGQQLGLQLLFAKFRGFLLSFTCQTSSVRSRFAGFCRKLWLCGDAQPLMTAAAYTIHGVCRQTYCCLHKIFSVLLGLPLANSDPCQVVFLPLHTHNRKASRSCLD